MSRTQPPHATAESPILLDVVESEPMGFDLDEFIARCEKLKSKIRKRVGGDVTDSAETIRRNREQRWL